MGCRLSRHVQQREPALHPVSYTHLDVYKRQGVTYISGSIEDPIINGRIVDILEGTRPAFDKRDDKYLP